MDWERILRDAIASAGIQTGGAGSVGATQREAGERFATIVAQNARGYPFASRERP